LALLMICLAIMGIEPYVEEYANAKYTCCWVIRVPSVSKTFLVPELGSRCRGSIPTRTSEESFQSIQNHIKNIKIFEKFSIKTKNNLFLKFKKFES
jgi:hypothetical protein